MAPGKTKTTTAPVSAKRAGGTAMVMAKVAVMGILLSLGVGLHMLEGDPFAVALAVVFAAGLFVGKRW